MNFNSKGRHKIAVVIALALVAIIAISAVIISVLTPKETPVSTEYITVSIDNSVSATFTLDNNDYSVTSASTYRKSDSYLVENISDTYLSFSQAMDSFLKALAEAKKLPTGNDGILLFSVESRNEKDFDILSSYFRNALRNAELETRVYTLYIKVKLDSTIQLAEKYNVSYAKAHLCTKLEKENSKLKAEELINLSITEIVERANKAGEDDLVSRVESNVNEEQRQEEIPEDKPEGDGSTSSSNSSSNITSSDSTSDGTSSDSSSSDTTSSNNSSDSPSSDNNVSYIVSDDDGNWTPRH